MSPTPAERRAAEAAASSDVSVLRELSHHRFTAVREAVALNPATPFDVLTELAADRHHLPRYGVAGNEGPHAVAVALAAEDPGVRVILAQRRDLDSDTYDALVGDEHHEVRVALAERTDRIDLIERLAEDSHHDVRSVAANSDVCPPALVGQLSQDRDNRVRAAVSSRPDLPEEVLQRLLADSSANVRWWLLVNHPDRRDIAEVLAEDTDEMNASQARTQLSWDAGEPSPPNDPTFRSL
jgi:hypothetical protein